MPELSPKFHIALRMRWF